MLVEWKGGDRRRSPRCRAWGWLLGWIGGALKVSVVDISMGGALIEHSPNMRPGTSCVLTLSPRGTRVNVRCRVVRSAVYRYETWPLGEQNCVYRTGLELVDVSETSQFQIGRCIEFLEGVAGRYQNQGHVFT